MIGLEKEQQKIVIYSYAKVWKIEKKIYAIQNMILPVPIDPWQLLYFGGTWLVCNIIFGAIPGFNNIPVILRSILLPFFISKFLMSKKLDGKNPIRYALGIIIFLFTEQGNVLEHFKFCSQRNQNVKLAWNCSEGKHIE